MRTDRDFFGVNILDNRAEGSAAVLGDEFAAVNLSFHRENTLAVVPETSSAGLVFGLFAFAFAAIHRFH